jgi:hypothetical protein
MWIGIKLRLSSHPHTCDVRHGKIVNGTHNIIPDLILACVYPVSVPSGVFFLHLSRHLGVKSLHSTMHSRSSCWTVAITMLSTSPIIEPR